MATEASKAVRVPQWTVGDRLRKAREEAGIGVEEIATMLDRNRNSVTRYERSHTVDRVGVVATAWVERWMMGRMMRRMDFELPPITPEMVAAFLDDMVRRGQCIAFPEPVALDSPECAAAHELLTRKN